MEIRVFLCNSKQKHVYLQNYINDRYCRSKRQQKRTMCNTDTYRQMGLVSQQWETVWFESHKHNTVPDSFTTHFTYESFTLTAHVCSHVCVMDTTTTTELVQFCFQLDRMLHSLWLIRSHTLISSLSPILSFHFSEHSFTIKPTSSYTLSTLNCTYTDQALVYSSAY